MQPSTVLVIGAGSIGERHAQVVLSQPTPPRVVVLRSRMLPYRSLNADAVVTVTSWEAALAVGPEVAIVCTPTHMHVEQTIQAMRAGLDVLCEKPLSTAPAQTDELAHVAHETGRYMQIAYMLPFHPLMSRLVDIITGGELGRLVHVDTYWGEYLPHWHPWEDYRQSYAARRDMGGGAALTLSHDLDLALRLGGGVGQLARHHTHHNYSSDLGIDAETGADILLTYDNGTTAHCHMAMHDLAPRRHYRATLTNGVVEVDYIAGTLTVTRVRADAPDKKPQKDIIHQPADWQRNNMFAAQWVDFCRNRNAPNSRELTAQAIRNAELIARICQQSA